MMFKQILEVLIHLGDNKVYHRDIKPENMVVSSDLELKLIDFGTCAHADSALTQLNEQFGTDGYMAPEVRNNRPYTGEKSDVYSLGCFLFALVCSTNNLNLIEKYSKVKRLEPSIWETLEVSEDLK
jgi:serine/threonine protein kinase